MKNLIVFITPRKKFFGEYGKLVQVWIDNSLDLGWKTVDLLLVTNFRFKYNGVKAWQAPDSEFCPPRPRSIKTSILPFLIDADFIKEGDLVWNHDLDAFQVNPFDLQMAPEIDLGLTDYGWKPRWCMGSYFFRSTARDIFGAVTPVIFQDVEDETVMLGIEAQNEFNFKDRHVRLNVTYNFGMRNVEDNWLRTEHPVKVAHFHPLHKQDRTWDVFVLGKNGMGQPIVNARLIQVFKYHGMGYGI